MIKTPQTHPDHEVVGRFWGAHSYATNKTEIYYCDSYDSSCGYWMTNVHNPEDRHNISERAPWRTWWPADDKGDYFWVTQWGMRVSKGPAFKIPQSEAKPTAEALNQPVTDEGNK